MWYLLTQDGPCPGHENVTLVVPVNAKSASTPAAALPAILRIDCSVAAPPLWRHNNTLQWFVILSLHVDTPNTLIQINQILIIQFSLMMNYYYITVSYLETTTDATHHHHCVEESLESWLAVFYHEGSFHLILDWLHCTVTLSHSIISRPKRALYYINSGID